MLILVARMFQTKLELPSHVVIKALIKMNINVETIIFNNDVPVSIEYRHRLKAVS